MSITCIRLGSSSFCYYQNSLEEAILGLEHLRSQQSPFYDDKNFNKHIKTIRYEKKYQRLCTTLDIDECSF